MANCSSPRPITLNVSWPNSSTRMETLVSSSLSSLSRRLREVTYVPSRPTNGEVLMVNVMAMVGSSICAELVAVGRRTAVEDQAIVSIVHDQVEAPLFAQFHHARHKFLRVHHPRRIIRAVEDDRQIGRA